MVNIHERKGFTLIELLVIIIIIGLLAVAVIVSLNSVRAKARDSKRVSDVRQMSKLLDNQEASTPGSNLVGCAGGDVYVKRCVGPGDIVQFNTMNFADPSNSATVCANGISATCQYSISQAGGGANPKTSDYEICFFLEQNVTGIGVNMQRIGPAGVFNSGCN